MYYSGLMSDLSALHRVHLHLHGVVHGAIREHTNDFIDEYAHVPDVYYDRAARALDGMDPKRGDVLAVEDYGFCGSSIWDWSDLRHMDPQDARNEIEESRRERESATFEYLAELGLLAGLVVHRADVRHSDVARLEALSRSKERYDERETIILESLGAIATGMPPPTPEGELAQLTYVAGTFHLLTLSERLDEAKIPYTTNRNPTLAVAVDVARYFGWKGLDHVKSLFGFGLARKLEKQLTL